MEEEEVVVDGEEEEEEEEKEEKEEEFHAQYIIFLIQTNVSPGCIKSSV